MFTILLDVLDGVLNGWYNRAAIVIVLSLSQAHESCGEVIHFVLPAGTCRWTAPPRVFVRFRLLYGRVFVPVNGGSLAVAV